MNKKKIYSICLICLLIATLMGCGKSDRVAEINLDDGQYQVDFDTDSTMFHVNETMDGKAVMTVTDHTAVVNIVLTSTNIEHLYLGLAEDASKDGAELLNPVVTTVTYDDGTTEEVNSFDVPVPCLDEEFDLAIIGTKGIWYDHKVSVSNLVPYEDMEGESGTAVTDETSTSEADSSTVTISLEGGSGKASIESPASCEKTEDGYLVTLIWSSPYYDYMIVDGTTYEPVNTEGNSTFEIPVSDLTEPLEVIADTVAMSEPHEIDYTITFAQ